MIHNLCVQWLVVALHQVLLERGSPSHYNSLMMSTGESPRFLDPVVWSALCDLGRRFSGRGLRVFLFGSFAAGTQRPGSDLDLGFEVTANTPASIIDELRHAVEELPTIRHIDLVDFSRADQDFVRVARTHMRELA